MGLARVLHIRAKSKRLAGPTAAAALSATGNSIAPERFDRTQQGSPAARHISREESQKNQQPAPPAKATGSVGVTP